MAAVQINSSSRFNYCFQNSHIHIWIRVISLHEDDNKCHLLSALYSPSFTQDNPDGGGEDDNTMQSILFVILSKTLR